MARSGTSLLRTLLDGHPDLAVATETHFLDHWLQRFRHLDLTRPEDFDRFWSVFTDHPWFQRLGVSGEAVRGEAMAHGPPTFRSVFTALLRTYARRTGKERWGEKTPSHYRHLDVLFDWYPDARVLFMIRDPRAVAASHVVLDEPWARGDVYEFTRRWRMRMAEVSRWSEDQRVRPTRYEDLVNDPERELRSISEFVRVPFHPETLLDRRPSSDDVRVTGSYQPSAPVRPSNVEKWRERLSPDDVAIIEHLGREHMLEHGYAPMTVGLTARQRVTLIRQVSRQGARLLRAGVLRAKRSVMRSRRR